jgi:hypothetical protein
MQENTCSLRILTSLCFQGGRDSTGEIVHWGVDTGIVFGWQRGKTRTPIQGLSITFLYEVAMDPNDLALGVFAWLGGTGTVLLCGLWRCSTATQVHTPTRWCANDDHCLKRWRDHQESNPCS